jgi:hypothetical protein
MKRHERQAALLLRDRLGERRASMRFPIVSDMRYEVSRGRGLPKSGIGRTVNMSSRGVLFAAPEVLPPGKRIRLSVSWPAQLDGKYALKLLAWGWITRCEGTNVAMEIENYEFRTQSSGELMPA